MNADADQNRNQDPAAPPPDPYRIFRCWDGATPRSYDPRALLRALHAEARRAGETLQTLWAVAFPRAQELPDGSFLPPTEDQADAADAARLRLDGVLRAAFGFAPFDPATGAGLTEDEALAQADAFTLWLAKKNASTAT